MPLQSGVLRPYPEPIEAARNIPPAPYPHPYSNT